MTRPIPVKLTTLFKTMQDTIKRALSKMGATQNSYDGLINSIHSGQSCTDEQQNFFEELMFSLVEIGRSDPESFLYMPTEFAAMEDPVLNTLAHLTAFLGYTPTLYTGPSQSDPEVAEAGKERALRFAAILYLLEDLALVAA